MTNTVKNMGKLQVTTPSEREIAMTRIFDAPRSLVFDAWTKPELLKRWLGVRGGWTFAVCEVDLRVGGSYRFVWRGPTGAEMGMGGVYREIVRPERLVATERFDEPWYEGDALDTTTFVERGGKTTATTTVRYASQEVRDAVLKTPMLTGVAESYDKMAEELASRVGQGVQ
ncbi:MAG TPA: SRPBCC family protein [Gemmatimonadales bacterium]|nr:SRPBCC family protein [Gemmatimonadales bacterium]